MKRTSLYAACLILAAMFPISCTRTERDRVDRETAEAKREVRELGRDIKKNAKELARDVKRETNKVTERASNAGVRVDADHVEDKMRTAAERARSAGSDLKAGAGDLALTSQVKTALANDSGLKTLTDISVSTNEGVVTLSGRVASATEHKEAVRVASRVPGVSRVVDHLSVH